MSIVIRAPGPLPAPERHASLADFLDAKGPVVGFEFVLCILYWLTRERGCASVRVADLRRAAVSSGLSPRAISWARLAYARRTALIHKTSDGALRVTPRGEAVVRAFPDRRAAAEVRELQRVAVLRARPSVS